MFSAENVSGVAHSTLSRELWVVIRCSVWFIMLLCGHLDVLGGA